MNKQATRLLIDNVSQHETPEGVLLTLVPAGILPRGLAWCFDAVIRLLIVATLAVPMFFLKEVGYGLFLIVYFFLEWLYPVYFDVFKGGISPGKKVLGIYVCHDDGTPINLQSSMIRNLLRVADFLPNYFSFGIISMLVTDKSQRIGDLLAGTVVAYQEQDDAKKIFKRTYGKKLVEDKLNAPLETSNSSTMIGADVNSHNQSHAHDYATNSPLFTFPLTYKEQQAMLSLADRLVFLPLQRQHEITGHLSPLVTTHNSQGKQTTYNAVLAKSAQIRGTA